ncbi:MAG: RNA pseudouridine synthase [Victivallales bacterium]|jgi:23S rRNA pseudouridine1911/1915/1917 synthase|nr:RNA pseudouridine synthase [Victivallales bacterium]
MPGLPSIVYVDNHLLCLDKPGGLLTQPSGTDRDSLEAWGKAWLKEEYHKPGAVFLEAVHRIDAPVCGLVLFARTSKALSRLNEAVRNGACTKEYRALVAGVPKVPQAELRNWLTHDDHLARVVPKGTPNAHLATLQYELLERRPNNTSLLRILLGSGRYHQIRVQLSHAGFPIAGDNKYGAKLAYREGCIALQHYRLTVPHPISKELLTFTSALTL